MLARSSKLMAVLLGLGLIVGGAAWAQVTPDQAVSLNAGYELLEKGETAKAQRVYEEMLRKYPGNPVALNNLAAILAKKGRYGEALNYLDQALSRAKGYKVMVDRVCDIESICTVFRVSPNSMGGGDLEDLIKTNILMVKMAAATPGKRQ